jgi:hypothetical protein
MQPLSHTRKCSQVQIDLSCTNNCFSQASQSSIEHVLVESCDELIDKGNDELKRLENFKETCMYLRRRAKFNILKINVRTWWRTLRRDKPSLAQLLNNIQKHKRTRFKKRVRLGTSSPNIAQPSIRHKNHPPRSLEAQTSGECATSAERRVTLPTLAQVP